MKEARPEPDHWLYLGRDMPRIFRIPAGADQTFLQVLI